MSKKFKVSLAPHLHSAQKSSKMIWPFVLALLPAAAAAIFQNMTEGFRIFGFYLAAAGVLEAAGAFLIKKKPDLSSGAWILSACLLAMLTPWKTDLSLLILSSALAFGMLAFYGGRTRAWVHPSWLGAAVLALHQPAEFISKNSPILFWNPFSGGVSPLLMTAALLAGGLYLCLSRQILWKLPAIYLSMVLIPCLTMGLHTTLSLPVVLLNAFWVIPGNTAVPCSVRARLYFAAGAAVLTLLMDLLSVPAAAVFAVLMMNSVLPWMDQWILPRGITLQAQSRRAA